MQCIFNRKMAQATYSTDLRSRVIEYIKAGNEQKAAAKLFTISTSTISRWWIRYQAEGVVEPKPKGGSKGRVDSKSLQDFVLINGDKTLKEIGEHFKISICSVFRRLKKLGFSYKKKPSATWKQVPKKEKDI